MIDILKIFGVDKYCINRLKINYYKKSVLFWKYVCNHSLNLYDILSLFWYGARLCACTFTPDACMRMLGCLWIFFLLLYCLFQFLNLGKISIWYSLFWSVLYLWSFKLKNLRYSDYNINPSKSMLSSFKLYLFGRGPSRISSILSCG